MKKTKTILYNTFEEAQVAVSDLICSDCCLGYYSTFIPFDVDEALSYILHQSGADHHLYDTVFELNARMVDGFTQKISDAFKKDNRPFILILTMLDMDQISIHIISTYRIEKS